MPVHFQYLIHSFSKSVMLSWRMAACIAFSFAFAISTFVMPQSICIDVSHHRCLSRRHASRFSTHRRCTPATDSPLCTADSGLRLSNNHLIPVHSLLRFQLLNFLLHTPKLNLNFLHLVVACHELLAEGGDVVCTAGVCEVGLETW